MARDHVLARTLPAGEGVLRLYRWARPTLSFGRNQPARGLFDLEAAERLGVDFVRRPTGGRTVLHHEELTYSVVLPVDAFGGLRRSYRLINQALLAGIERLGVTAALAESSASRAAPLDERACFLEPAEGELIARPAGVGGTSAPSPSPAFRKLIGSAQVRMGSVLLQHGSLPLTESQALVASLALAGDGTGDRDGMDDAPPAPADAGINLAAALGRSPGWDEVALAIEEGFRQILEGSWDGGPVAAPESGAFVDELRDHYSSPAWTWRL